MLKRLLELLRVLEGHKTILGPVHQQDRTDGRHGVDAHVRNLEARAVGDGPTHNPHRGVDLCGNQKFTASCSSSVSRGRQHRELEAKAESATEPGRPRRRREMT